MKVEVSQMTKDRALLKSALEEAICKGENLVSEKTAVQSALQELQVIIELTFYFLSVKALN